MFVIYGIFLSTLDPSTFAINAYLLILKIQPGASGRFFNGLFNLKRIDLVLIVVLKADFIVTEVLTEITETVYTLVRSSTPFLLGSLTWPASRLSLLLLIQGSLAPLPSNCILLFQFF